MDGLSLLSLPNSAREVLKMQKRKSLEGYMTVVGIRPKPDGMTVAFL